MIIDDILDMMDDLLDSAASVPFSVKKSIIDCDQMRDYINEIRLNLPQEIKQAKLIVRDRQSIMTDANKEADAIIRRAEDRAKVIVSNDEITKAAKARATDILNQAQAKAKELKNAANKYIDDVLVRTEECLQSNLADIRRTRQAVKTVPAQPQIQTAAPAQNPQPVRSSQNLQFGQGGKR
ncbi:MAG: ATPase [Oscillospiraceae bacterium]|nr:ATPase [Oscillospiraceae bacterium]MDE7279948.1 ATPase [Oscillospiraceae bacterium]